MNLIKLSVLGLLLIIFLQLGCIKPEKTPTNVEYEVGTSRFLKYLISAQVSAEPEEVDYYLRDPRNLIVSIKEVKIIPLSQKRFEKLGDRAEFQFELLGLKQTVVVTMIYHQPGEEIWYFIKQKDRLEGMSLFRFKLKKMTGGTKLNISWSLQISGVTSLFPSLIETLNINETMADIIEFGIAQGQVHFNPDLNLEDLLAEGRRGEFQEVFFKIINTGSGSMRP